MFHLSLSNVSACNLCRPPGVARGRDSGVLLLRRVSGSANGSGELQQIQQQLLQVSGLVTRALFPFACSFWRLLLRCSAAEIAWPCAAWTAPPASLLASPSSRCWDSWLTTSEFRYLRSLQAVSSFFSLCVFVGVIYSECLFLCIRALVMARWQPPPVSTRWRLMNVLIPMKGCAISSHCCFTDFFLLLKLFIFIYQCFNSPINSSACVSAKIGIPNIGQCNILTILLKQCYLKCRLSCSPEKISIKFNFILISNNYQNCLKTQHKACRKRKH